MAHLWPFWILYIPVITTKTLEVNQTSSSPIKAFNESPLCQKLSRSLSLSLPLSHITVKSNSTTKQLQHKQLQSWEWRWLTCITCRELMCKSTWKNHFNIAINTCFSYHSACFPRGWSDIMVCPICYYRLTLLMSEALSSGIYSNLILQDGICFVLQPYFTAPCDGDHKFYMTSNNLTMFSKKCAVQIWLQ